jgi:outer membrane protein assembly factor BamB
VYVDINGVLSAAAPDGAGGWFIGGRFTWRRRAGLAHVTADGALDPSWAPTLKDADPDEAEVGALCVVGDTVYVGGYFTAVNGRRRRNLAAVNARTGRVRAWNPRPNRAVYALAVASGRIYVGGFFTRIGSVRRRSLAAFDAATGALHAWNPTVTGHVWSAADPAVNTLVVDHGRLYVGGQFTSAGGHERYALAAFDLATGALNAWNPGTGPANVLAIAGNTVYVGGNFAVDLDIDGEFERNALAAFDARTGRMLPWRADALWAGDRGNVQALAVVGDRLYVGGEFDELAGQPRDNLGVVSATTGAPLPWELPPSGGEYSLVAGGDRVLVGGTFDTVGG